MSRGKHKQQQLAAAPTRRRAALTCSLGEEGPSARELRYLQKEQQRQHETTTTTTTTSHMISDGTTTTTTSRRRRRVPSSSRNSSKSMMIEAEPSSSSTTTISTMEDASVEEQQLQQRKDTTPTTRHRNNLGARPLLRLETTIIAVSEDSCLSDHSSCGDNNNKQKIAQKKHAKVAPKKKPRATKHSFQSTIRVAKKGTETVRRTQRQRVATQFFQPRSSSMDVLKSVVASSAPRQTRRRVATEDHPPPAKRVRRTQQSNQQPTRTSTTTQTKSAGTQKSRAWPKDTIHKGAQSSRHVAFADDDYEEEEEESYSNDEDDETFLECHRRSSIRSHGANIYRPATRSSAKNDSSERSDNLKRRLRGAQQPQRHSGPTLGLLLGEHVPGMATPVEGAALRTTNPAVSLDALLSRYESLARAGRVEPVHFGTSLHTAQDAIERKLRELCQKYPANGVPDFEVTEDIKAYRRSLRVFKDFEDQEKLALEEEYEEVVEAWRRRGGRRKPNHEKVEEANFAHRPLVFSQHRRIPARHSQCTQPCGLCHGGCAKTPPLEALVPGMRRIDIDHDDDECRSTSTTRRSTTTTTATPPAPSRVSTRSADVTLKVQWTRRQLGELQHALTFVDEYAAGWFGC